ncbi:hypothetical protein [Emticicia sp. W12TSBA100-4]|uniref:hypothetical protein n=1 Tax=Emticicia sp. W12TSBA100-4 TaxID=3160965 RepID=UPI0033058C5A
MTHQTTSNPVLEPNVIGQAYFNSDEVTKAHFIEVAERIALKNGSKLVKFRRIFQETHAYLPIANVYTYFLHAAHQVYGINFDFRVSARSANAKTIVQEYEGKRIELSIESI